MDKLTDPQIADAIKSVPDWSQVGETIQRTYEFRDFLTSLRFVNAVAQAAEAAQHHPDILIRYNRVTLTLETHDAHGLTAKDFALAVQSDTFAAQITAP